MTMVFRRTAIWFVILAVALASAYVGFQLAQGQSVAQIGRSVGVQLDQDFSQNQVPPHVCYKQAPREHNPHCNGGNPGGH